MSPDAPSPESSPNAQTSGAQASGAPEIQAHKRRICPYLGLRHDRTVIAAQATEAHACYAQSKRIYPSIEHQKAWCFTDRYTACSYYPRTDQPSGRAADLFTLVDSTKPRRRRWGCWLVLLVVLALLGGATFAYLNGMIPARWLQLPAGLADFVPGAATVTPAPAQATAAAEPATPEATSTEAASTGAASTGAASTGAAGSKAGSVTPEATTPAPTTPAPATVEAAVPPPTTPEAATPDVTVTASPPAPSPTPRPTAAPTATRAAPTATPSPAATATAAAPPPATAQTLTLVPAEDEVGWWLSSELASGTIGDTRLYAGFQDQIVYIAAVRFDLGEIPPDLPITGATLRLVGLDDTDLAQDADVSWSVQLIAESDLSAFATVDFVTIFAAPAAITLSPALQPSDLAPGMVNEWQFDVATLAWLNQQVADGAGSFTIRIMPFPVVERTLFAWDSGYGAASQGAPPTLLIDLGQDETDTP